MIYQLLDPHNLVNKMSWLAGQFVDTRPFITKLGANKHTKQ